MKVIISMEATCDLPQDLIKKYDLSVIDMNFSIGEKEYSTINDGVVSSELYTKMQHGEKTHTAQINEFEYEEFFRNLLRQNLPIIHIGFASSLSGTLQTAQRVAEKLTTENNTNKIVVIDSLCACSGQGMLGILARTFANQAKTLQEVCDYIESIKLKLNHSFTVDTLKYLAQGGRVKKTSEIIGTILNIKPIMKMNNNGDLVVISKTISRKKALINIYENFTKNWDKTCNLVVISHANCQGDADFIKDRIKTDFNIDALITNLGPIIGSHSGPGTFALYYLSSTTR